jgi:hypothetical protein
MQLINLPPSSAEVKKDFRYPSASPLYAFTDCSDREKFAMNGMLGPAKRFSFLVFDGSTQKVEPQFLSPRISALLKVVHALADIS